MAMNDHPVPVVFETATPMNTSDAIAAFDALLKSGQLPEETIAHHREHGVLIVPPGPNTPEIEA